MTTVLKVTLQGPLTDDGKPIWVIDVNFQTGNSSPVSKSYMFDGTLSVADAVQATKTAIDALKL